MGGKDVAPLRPVGDDVTVDSRKLPILAPSFQCKFLILQFGNKSCPVTGDSVSVTSINCISSYLLRLYTSFPTETLRWFGSV